MAQWLTNPTSNHGVVGLTPGLTQWVKDCLGTSIFHGSGPRKDKNTQKKRKKKKKFRTKGIICIPMSGIFAHHNASEVHICCRSFSVICSLFCCIAFYYIAIPKFVHPLIT